MVTAPREGTAGMLIFGGGETQCCWVWKSPKGAPAKGQEKGGGRRRRFIGPPPRCTPTEEAGKKKGFRKCSRKKVDASTGGGKEGGLQGGGEKSFSVQGKKKEKKNGGRFSKKKNLPKRGEGEKVKIHCRSERKAFPATQQKEGRPLQEKKERDTAHTVQ